MGFADSVGKTSGKMQAQLNAKALEIADELFTTVVKNTPVGASKTKGQLINNWFVGQGIGQYSSSYTSSFNTSGMNSYSQIKTLSNSKEFEGKDGEVSFTNNVPYAYRAEYWGWNFSAPEPRWRGSRPYGMVRNALTAVAAKLH
jgi:hypothetical protein